MSEQNHAPAPHDENQLIAERRDKLRALRESLQPSGGVAFPNDFKLSMFRNCTLKECDDELKELYAIYGKPKKVKKQK